MKIRPMIPPEFQVFASFEEYYGLRNGNEYVQYFKKNHEKLGKPRTQMTDILEDLTHKMEGQPPKREVI